MPHAHYSLDDFLLDESFQAYAAGKDEQAVRYWQQWLAEHPGQQADAQQAQALLQDLAHAHPQPVPAGLREQELRKFQRARRVLSTTAPRLRSQRRAWRWATSLVMVLLVVGSLGWWLRRPNSPASAARYATATGQQHTITLPDGSVVTLNGNSTLTTAAAWKAETPREVWLTGEGYFRVTHRATQPVTDINAAPSNVKFVVHAGKLNIAVLGTEFDVSSQATGTKVVLNSGRVAVERQALLTRENLLMQPGDLVETSATSPGLNRRHVQPALYSGWTRGQLEFHQTPVSEVVQLLRDKYNLQVEVTDSALLQQAVTGDLPATDPGLLLPALAKSLDIRVIRTGDTVRLLPAAR
ncbi:MAG: FecR domain-containing protein [Janthinobacterium lividum]